MSTQQLTLSFHSAPVGSHNVMSAMTITDSVRPFHFINKLELSVFFRLINFSLCHRRTFSELVVECNQLLTRLSVSSLLTPGDLFFDLFLFYCQTKTQTINIILHTLLSYSQLLSCLLSLSLRFLNGFLPKQSLLLWSWYLVLSNFCASIVSVDGRVKVVSVHISTQTWQWGRLTMRSGFLLPFICAENHSPVSFSPLSRSDTMYFDVCE